MLVFQIEKIQLKAAAEAFTYESNKIVMILLKLLIFQLES